MLSELFSFTTRKAEKEYTQIISRNIKYLFNKVMFLKFEKEFLLLLKAWMNKIDLFTVVFKLEI